MIGHLGETLVAPCGIIGGGMSHQTHEDDDERKADGHDESAHLVEGEDGNAERQGDDHHGDLLGQDACDIVPDLRDVSGGGKDARSGTESLNEGRS